MLEQFEIVCLRYTLEATTPIKLGVQAGNQMRGALYEALMKVLPPTADAAVKQLMDRENPVHARGRNVPRPFSLMPPLPEAPGDDQLYAPGDTFTVGLNLFGNTGLHTRLFTLAMQRAGDIGIGYNRGRFTVSRIEAVHPLRRMSQTLFDSRTDETVSEPVLRVTATDVDSIIKQLPSDRVCLTCLTPLHLVDGGKPVTKIAFRPLIARLIERLEALEHEYADGTRWRDVYLRLTKLAETIRCDTNRTRWLHVRGGSRRQNQRLHLGGLVGTACFTGELSPFLPVLVWGTLTQAGKNVVKGNGWYTMQSLPG